MGTSGSADFSLTRDGIIRGAIRIVKGMGGKPIEGAITAQEEFSNAAQALNMMMKQWQAVGIGLWTNKEINIPLSYNDGTYSLGTSGDRASETLVVTELAAAVASAATSITVDSITGISDGDYIGIELSSTYMQWTTVNGTPSGTTINLDDALSSSSSADAEVMAYTTKSGRPLTITEARWVSDSGTETSIQILDRDEWMLIANKSSKGTPSQVYYDPQLDSGILNVWPRPNDVSGYLKLSARMPIEDFDNSTDAPPWPQEIYRAAKWNLVDEIAMEYPGIDPQKFLFASNKAANLLDQLMDFDAETGSIRFEVDYND